MSHNEVMGETPTTDPRVIWIDGLWVNEETGEVTDIEGLPQSFRPTEEDVKEQIAVSDEDVEWALKKLFRLDGALVAAETRLKAERAAIDQNWKPTVNRLKGTREWFAEFVKPRLRAYAEGVLAVRNAGKKTPDKSIKNPHGVLAFRALPNGSISKGDDPKAAEVREMVAWTEKAFPNAIKQEPALDLDKLTPEQREVIFRVERGEITWEEAGWPGPCPLKVTLPGDQFDIRTGVKAEK